MNREEYESYARRIIQLENHNKLLLDQLSKFIAVSPIVYEMKCDKSLIEESIIQENTNLKAELQAVRNILKELEWNGINIDEKVACPYCDEEASRKIHKPKCALKSEIDKLPPNPKEES